LTIRWINAIFREQALLVDEKNSTLSNKQWVAMVVAHELAHQWFGNLVTMRWWTDLWLNEGFASWIEFLAVDRILPDWEMWTQFTVSEQQQALKLDALEHTHPIEVAVNHPDEIRSIFDAISYSKGASVIHMLHEYLGPEWFRDGLRHYLNKHKYGNTDTIDLWTALEEISGKPVREFMHTWTSQSGFPILRATVQNNEVTLEQERFFLNPKHGKVAVSTWPVPLLSDQIPEQLSEKAGQYSIKDSSKFLLNKGQSGFYRIAYNSTHLERLGNMVRTGHMDPIDRLGLLSDVFETARAGKSDTADALHFLENFRHENNYAVWDVIANSLGNMRLVMESEEMRELMRPYTRDLIASELERLGWDQSNVDSHFDKLLRPIILGQAAVADEPAIINHCRKLFNNINEPDDLVSNLRQTTPTSEIKRGLDIDPDMRGVVFGTISRIGDKSDFEKLVRMHNASTLSEERTTLAAAITGFRQSALIDRALAMIDTPEVRLQDVSYWVAYSFLNRHAKKQTWEWLKSHWKWLEKNLGTDLSFYRTPIYAARVFSDDSFIKEYKAFFEPKLSPALDRSYNQGLEILQWHCAWKQRDQKEIMAFFRDSNLRLKS
jgi:aminopeptidase N